MNQPWLFLCKNAFGSTEQTKEEWVARKFKESYSLSFHDFLYTYRIVLAGKFCHNTELLIKWCLKTLVPGTSQVVQRLRLCFHCRRHRFNPWSGKWDPTCCVVQPNKQDFPGGSVVKNPPARAGDRSSILCLGRSHLPEQLSWCATIAELTCCSYWSLWA